ncbi:MAG: hypothetical protein IM638_13775 [Bacteroidetes bacterium]|nr:hypothetical protein [Bacteroidota bacterium]
MSRFFFFLLCLPALIALHSCGGNEPKPLPPQESLPTRVFRKYLHDVFADSIPQQRHVYIMVPGKGCKGCMANTLERVRQLRPDSTYTTIIISSINTLPEEMYPVPFLFDEKGVMERINLRISNVTVIRTEHARIRDMRNFDGIFDRGLDSLIRWH